MISAINRLQELPEVFQGIDVMRSFGWTSKQTNEVLTRWKNKGFVDSLGKRLDVYSNNLKLTKDLRLHAMLLKFDKNVLDLSHKVWSENEWTTQYPTREIVVSLKLFNDVKTDEVYLKHKPLRWLKTIHQGLRIKQSTDELYTLKPEWLLAESLFGEDQDLWCPEPDDLDFDAIETTTTLTDWNAAFKAMATYYNKVYQPAVESLEDCYNQLYYKPASESPKY